MTTENLTPRDWTIETNIDVVKNAIRSYKAWRTKKLDILKAAIDQHNQVKSHYTAKSVKEAFQSYQHKQFNAEGGYAWLSENDEAHKEIYETRLNELTVEYSCLLYTSPSPRDRG